MHNDRTDGLTKVNGEAENNMSKPCPTISRRNALASITGTGAMLIGSTVTAAAAEAGGERPAEADGIGTVWWVELVAANGVKSAEYYNSVIGWTSKRTSLEDGAKPAQANEPAYTLFIADGNEVAGSYQVDSNDPVKNKPMWIVYFRVDSVDKAISRAVGKGGRVLLSPYDVPGVARMALLADVDNIPFGIAAPL